MSSKLCSLERKSIPLGYNVTYKYLIENLFIKFIYTTLSSPTLSTTSPCNLENKTPHYPLPNHLKV